jgi:pyruvate dehydrogenase E2 component (dihydrolipoamide acetyltransferase)
VAQLSEIRVPDLGEFKDVEIIDVLIKPGEPIALEGPVVTLETEKATLDVPSTIAGMVREVKVKRGDRVSQGDLLALVEPAAESQMAQAPAAAETARPAAETQAPTEAAATETAPARDAKAPPASGVEAPAAKEPKAPATDAKAPVTVAKAPATEVKAAVTEAQAPPRAPAESAKAAPASAAAPASVRIDEPGFSRSHASPSVRRFARELGADLASIEGSGEKGRITADDVKAYVKRRLTAPAAAPAAALPKVPVVDYAAFGPVERKRLSRIQKISGPRLHASWVNIPHVTQFDEADITDMEAARLRLKDEAAAKGIKLTPLAFVMRACVKALAEFPQFAASLDEAAGELVIKRYVHIGFAADTPNGLVVPVVRDADRKDVFELARELATLSEKARSGKLAPNDMQGGCFTISSLGGIGGTAFTPIINAPEVAILGVSRSAQRPVFENGQFVPRLMLPLSLSYDHRVIDGAAAARFTTFLARTLADAAGLMQAIP